MKRSLSDWKKPITEDAGSPVLELIPNEIKKKEEDLMLKDGYTVYFMKLIGQMKEEKYVELKMNQETVLYDNGDNKILVIWKRVQGTVKEQDYFDVIFEYMNYSDSYYDSDYEADKPVRKTFWIKHNRVYDKMKGITFMVEIYRNHEIEEMKKIVIPDNLERRDSIYSHNCNIYVDKHYSIDEVDKIVVKQIRDITNEKARVQYLNELRIYKELKSYAHPNICYMKGLTIMNNGYGSRYPSLVLQHGEDLRNYLFGVEQNALEKGDLKIYYEEVERCINQMIEGVKYFHQLGYIHYDIKLENFIIINNVVKLIDFGISMDEDELRYKLPVYDGTDGYVAPEVSIIPIMEKYALVGGNRLMPEEYFKVQGFKYSNVNHRLDIWSLGCCFLVMLKRDCEKMTIFKKMKHITEYPDDAIILIEDCLSEYDKITGHGERMKEILKGMLKENPNSRTELENIVIPLFNGV